tara:strand:+ start:521 stop:745 length:225 start_codon:yes stop_codon:yes gene_type:complete
MDSEQYLPGDWKEDEILELFDDFVNTFNCNEAKQEYMFRYYSELSEQGRLDMLDWMCKELVQNMSERMTWMCPN